MSKQEEDLKALVDRLCARYGTTDLDALYKHEAFEKAYTEEYNKNPTLSHGSLTGKALKAMALIQQKGVDIQAHCAEPRYEFIRYDRDEKTNVCKAIGIQVVTQTGQPMFVKYQDRDPTVPLDDQFKAAGLPGAFTRACPVTLHKVDVVEDLEHGTIRASLTDESTVAVGGHANPFPEGPDLEYLVGQTAMERAFAAWRIDKKWGVLKGKFGDTEGDPKFAVLTITRDPQAIHVRAFEDDAPEKHVVAAPAFDQRGNGVGIKPSVRDTCEQLGLPDGSSEDLIKSKIAGQRLLVRGQGSIFMPKSPADFGEDGAVFWSAWKKLSEEGYLKGYGDKGNVRLNLSDKFILTAEGQRVPQRSVRIGDRDVYDIVQKGTIRDEDGNEIPKLEISTLAADENKLPWMSCYGKPTKGWTDDEGVHHEGYYNRNAFLLFLDGIHASSEMREDDPFHKLASGLPAPPIAKRLQQQKIEQTTNGTAKAQPAASAEVPPPGSRLINAPSPTKTG